MQRTALISSNLYKKISTCLLKQSPRTISTSTSKLVTFKVQDDKDFLEKVENSKEPIIVDFFANWCGPCKALNPRLENVVAKHKVSIAKVDIDNMGEIAAKYEVSTIPALVVFKNGKATERLVGLQDEDKLDLWVNKVLKD